MPLGFDPVGSSALTETQATSSAVSISVTLSGLAASMSVGTTGFKTSPKPTPNGVIGQTFLGIPTVAAKAGATLTGLVGNAAFSPQVSIEANGTETVLLAGLAMRGHLGLAVVATEVIPAAVTLTGLSATGQIGTATVGGVDTAFSFDVEGVVGLGAVGDVLIKQTADVPVTGLVGTMPTTFDTKVLVSMFGADIKKAKASKWVVVKPA